MVLFKKLLYLGNFNLGKDFQPRQKVKACLFICVNEPWLLNDFPKKNSCLTNFEYQKHANYGKTIPLPSTSTLPAIAYLSDLCG